MDPRRLFLPTRSNLPPPPELHPSLPAAERDGIEIERRGRERRMGDKAETGKKKTGDGNKGPPPVDVL